MAECGKLWSLVMDKNMVLYLVVRLIAAGLVIATVVFPFWNLIREDVFEEVEILTNEGWCLLC